MVVLSYAHDDREQVLPLSQAFIAAGADVYNYAVRQHRSVGQPLREELAAAFDRGGSVYVPFASKRYENKHWTSLELGLMLSQQRRSRRRVLFPVSIDGTTLTGLEDVVHWRLDSGAPLADFVQTVVDADRARRGERQRWCIVGAITMSVICSVGDHHAGAALATSGPRTVSAAPLAERLRMIDAFGNEMRLRPFVNVRIIDRGRVACSATTDDRGRIACRIPAGHYIVAVDAPGAMNPQEMEVWFQE